MGTTTTHSPDAAAHLSPPAPGDLFFYNNHITDNQLKTALWVSAAVGGLCLLTFGIARKWVPTYKLRLSMPNVWVKPPPLPEGGVQQLWSWLYPVFTTSDAQLMRTAGLDSLMLCWTAQLGFQIFLPLTVIAMAVLLPINLNGNRVAVYTGEVLEGSLEFQRLTLSNLTRGAPTYWVAFVFVYVLTAYVCFLLLKYYQAYAILRQRYMTGGEAMINQWTQRICKGSQCATGEASEGKPQGEGTRMWNAIRELVDVNAQMGNLANSVSEETSLRRKYEAPLSMANYRRSTSLSRRPDTEPSEVFGGKRGGFMRASAPEAASAAREGHGAKGTLNPNPARATSLEDISLTSLAPAGALDSAALRARLHDAHPVMHPHRENAQGMEEGDKENSMRSSCMEDEGQEQGGAPSGQDMSRDENGAASGLSKWSSMRSRVLQLSTPSGSGNSEAAALHLTTPISRYETSYPHGAGPAQVHPWWLHDSEADQAEGGQLTGKPSVFFRKTINAQSSCGQELAVNAQQYAVLVMDVPDLRPAPVGDKPAPTRKAVGRMWSSVKTFLYPRVKHHRKKMKLAADAESKGLTGRQVVDAETPRREDEVVIHVTDPNGNIAMKKIATTANTMKLPQVGSDVETGLSSLASLASLQTVSEEEWHEEVVTLSPEQLVEATFKRLFPDSFLYALPVWEHKAVDELLWKWDAAYGKLQAAEAAFEASGCKRRPTHHLKKLRCRGEVDSIDFWASRVRQLESAISKEQKRILSGPASPSYFAFFSTQKDAALAAQTRIHPEDSHSFRVMEAPGPEEVNWQTLWKPRWQRSLREVLVLPLIILIMLVPLGLFTGTLAQTTSAICGGADARSSSKLAVLRTSWYCEEGSLIRPLITSLVPPLLLTTWQSLIMPIALYSLAQMEGKWVSCSSLDRRISALFFTWGVFNVFLGAMLGGSIFSKIRLIISEPSAIPQILGSALTTSSNFFINYVIIQAFAINPMRLVFPYFGVIMNLLQCCGLCRPRSDRDKVIAGSALSVGYGREVGMIMLIYIMAFAYAAVSPIILPFTLCFFTSSWIMWRYTMLYVTERCYESGGRVWDQVFNNVCWCLFICIFFTGCVFLANSAFTQACVMWVTLIPLLFRFHHYARARYGDAISHMPLETAQTAPHAKVDPRVYMPPQLRPGAAGWFPEYGKPWENWWLPAYVV